MLRVKLPKNLKNCLFLNKLKGKSLKFAGKNEREEVFYHFLDFLIKEYNLPERSFEKFIFLPYEKYSAEIIYLDKFIVYEDWWQRKPEIVKSKIKSILQISGRIYGRLCKVRKITKPEADLFLNENHILGSTNSKIKYGLFYGDELVSVATFAAQRQFRDGSRSAELLRICSKNNLTIVGGQDKLLKAYIREYQPDTIMSYIDLAWGKGDAFLKIGFEIKDKLASVRYFVNMNTGERINEKYFNDFENMSKYVSVKNSGSLKMVKKIRNN